MKIGTTPVSLKERIQSIHDTIRMKQVLNGHDLAVILEISEPYLNRLLRFYVQGINRFKLVKSNGHKFYVYFIGKMDRDKEGLMKKRYK